MEGEIVQFKTVKGTDLDTEVAAGAKLINHLRFGPVTATPYSRRSDTLRIFDALLGANVRASPAVDANARIDVVHLFVQTGNSFDGADLCTGRTPDTCLGNSVCHVLIPPSLPMVTSSTLVVLYYTVIFNVMATFPAFPSWDVFANHANRVTITP